MKMALTSPVKTIQHNQRQKPKKICFEFYDAKKVIWNSSKSVWKAVKIDDSAAALYS